MFIKTFEVITAYEKNLEVSNNTNHIFSTEFFMEFHKYIHLNNIGNPSSIILTYSYYSFNRKHNMIQSIKVDGFSFGSIPKFRKKPNLLFKSPPVKSDIICQRIFKPFDSRKPNHFLFQIMNEKSYQRYLVMKMSRLYN